jgi:hypothetical protein
MRPRHTILICVIAGWVGILLASGTRGSRDTANAEPPQPPVAELDRADSGTPVVEPPPEPPTPERLAAYSKIAAAHDVIEAAAVKKYGRKPRSDDSAAFTVPYKAFVNGQAQLANKKLATELGLSESEIERIKKDGDRYGWPRQ